MEYGGGGEGGKAEGGGGRAEGGGGRAEGGGEGGGRIASLIHILTVDQGVDSYLI